MTKLAENAGAGRRDTGMYDDLTRIKGIGEITQQWLRDTFGVYSFRDLANVPAAKIENTLKAEGKITARTKIEEWLAQAHALADEAGQPEIAEAPAAPEREQWKTVSTFVVMVEERELDGQLRYQTKAHHMEADSSQTWPGISPATLSEWLVGQLGLKGIEAFASATSEPAEVEEPEPALYSETLSRYIAKARALVGEPPAPKPRPSSRSVPAPRAASDQPHETVTPSGSLYSGKLQQVIMKARSLAGDRDAKRE